MYEIQFPSLPIADLEPWRADALCTQLVQAGEAEHRWWFPTSGGCPNAVRAKEICGRCPVAADCLAWALKVDEHDGIWGGVGIRERRTRPPRKIKCAHCGVVFEAAYTGAGGRLPKCCTERCRVIREKRKNAQASVARRERLKLQGVR